MSNVPDVICAKDRTLHDALLGLVYLKVLSSSPVNASYPHPIATAFSIHETEKPQMPGKGHNNVCPKYLLSASILRNHIIQLLCVLFPVHYLLQQKINI